MKQVRRKGALRLMLVGLWAAIAYLLAFAAMQAYSRQSGQALWSLASALLLAPLAWRLHVHRAFMAELDARFAPPVEPGRQTAWSFERLVAAHWRLFSYFLAFGPGMLLAGALAGFDTESPLERFLGPAFRGRACRRGMAAVPA